MDITLYYFKDDDNGCLYDINDIDLQSGGYPYVTYLVPYLDVSRERIDKKLRDYKRMKLLPDSVTVHEVTL